MKEEFKLCRECEDAEKQSGLDMIRVIHQLAIIKQNDKPKSKGLSDNEIRYLCLSISLYSPGAIAYCFYHFDNKIPTYEELMNDSELQQKINTVMSEMSKRVNRYIKEMLPDEYTRKPSWKKIIYLLKQKGYGI